MKKLLIGLLPAAVLLLGRMQPMPVQAAEPWDYTELADGSISITCTDTALTHAAIPAELDGHPVKVLGEQCFYGCTALTEVIIPDGVAVIESYAFQNCTSLTEVKLPASAERIADFCFEGCTSLEAITVAADNTHYCSADGVLFSAGQETLMRYPAAKQDRSYVVPDACQTLSPWSFTDCQYLQEISMKNVNAIGADAFLNCTQLRKAVLSNGIKELIGASFARCENLRTVKLPTNLQAIGDRCFFGCMTLDDIGTPHYLTKIGEMAFYGCVNLTELELPASLGEIGAYGLGYSVTEEGENTIIPELHLTVPFGSYAYQYARENGLKFKAYVPSTTLVMIGIIVLLVLMAAAGLVLYVRQKQRVAQAERERIAQEETQKRLAERRAAKKQKGKK